MRIIYWIQLKLGPSSKEPYCFACALKHASEGEINIAPETDDGETYYVLNCKRCQRNILSI